MSSNPDAFVSQKRLDEPGPVQGYWPGTPDLAVEMAFPDNRYTAAICSLTAWLEAGAKQRLVRCSPTAVQVLGDPGDRPLEEAADTRSSERAPGERRRSRAGPGWCRQRVPSAA